MVGPVSDTERSSFNRRVKIGVTVLVGASAGLISLQVDPTLPQAAGAVALGLLIGYLLARYVVPSGPAPATRQRQRRIEENPFADGGDGGDEDRGSDGDDERGPR
ncbi:MAG: hypothetical protein ABEJ26_12965 [Halosimplex sp.]